MFEYIPKYENTLDSLKDENELLKLQTIQHQLGFSFFKTHLHSDDSNVCKCCNSRFIPELKLIQKINKEKVGWE